jgi:hypothetical protein
MAPKTGANGNLKTTINLFADQFYTALQELRLTARRRLFSLRLRTPFVQARVLPSTRSLSILFAVLWVSAIECQLSLAPFTDVTTSLDSVSS